MEDLARQIETYIVSGMKQDKLWHSDPLGISERAEYNNLSAAMQTGKALEYAIQKYPDLTQESFAGIMKQRLEELYKNAEAAAWASLMVFESYE